MSQIFDQTRRLLLAVSAPHDEQQGASESAKGTSGSAPLITQEMIQAVVGGGFYRVRDTTIPTSGSTTLQAGQVVPVGWRDGKPALILAHSVQRARFIDSVQITTTALEELIYIDLGGGEWDIYFRNAKQFTALNIKTRVSSPLSDPNPLVKGAPLFKWGEKNNTFVVKMIRNLTSGGSNSGFPFPTAQVALPTFFIFALNRNTQSGLGATLAVAKLSRTLVCPLFPTQYLFDSIDVLPDGTVETVYPMSFPVGFGIPLDRTDYYLTADLDVAVLDTVSEFFEFTTLVNEETYEADHPMVVSCATRAVLYDHVFDGLGRIGHPDIGVSSKFVGLNLNLPRASMIRWSSKQPSRSCLFLPFEFSQDVIDESGPPVETQAQKRALYVQGPLMERLYLYPLEVAPHAVDDPPGTVRFPTTINIHLGNINDEHFFWALTQFADFFVTTTPVTERLYVVTPRLPSNDVVASVVYDYLTAQTNASPVFLQALITYARAFQALSLTTLFCIEEADESNNVYASFVNLSALWPVPADRDKFLRAFNSRGEAAPTLNLSPNVPQAVDASKNNLAKMTPYPVGFVPQIAGRYVLIGSG